MSESQKILLAELDAWFPEGVPILAMKVLFPEKSEPLTVDEMRAVMAALSASAKRGNP